MNSRKYYRRERELPIDSSIDNSKIYIPSCIFNEKLSSFETIAKFLKESYGFGFERIAKLLSKTRQSVWRAYKNASSKFPDSFEVTDLYYPVPITIFQDTSKPLLENIVVFLKDDCKLKYGEISALLARDDRTIWTAYDRAKRRKLEK